MKYNVVHITKDNILKVEIYYYLTEAQYFIKHNNLSNYVLIKGECIG